MDNRKVKKEREDYMDNRKVKKERGDWQDLYFTSL